MELIKAMYNGVLNAVHKSREHMRDAKIAPIRGDWDKSICNTITERE